MKLWLLDADILIDFLSFNVLDKLVKSHEIYTATSVIEEVKYFKKDGIRNTVSFREKYINTGLIKEITASVDDASELLNKLSCNKSFFVLDPGELESLSILIKNDDLIFCTCDAAAISTLPFLDLAARGISAEKLLTKSGFSGVSLKERHTEKYFKEKIAIGREQKIYQLSL